MPELTPTSRSRFLAMEVRDRFIKEIDGALPSLINVAGRALMSADFKDSKFTGSHSEAMLDFKASASIWSSGMHQAWAGSMSAGETRMGGGTDPLPTVLALVDDEEVESRILASRLVLGITEIAAQEMNDLRVRLRQLEGGQDLNPKDAFRPEVLARITIEQWVNAGLSRRAWSAIHETMRSALAHLFNEASHNANAFLIQRGILPQIDLKPLLKRAADVGVGLAGAGGSSGMGGVGGGASVISPSGGESIATDAVGGAPANAMMHRSLHGDRETQLLTSGSPMLRMRQRAQGVLGQLRKLLSDRIVDFDGGSPIVPSPELNVAMRSKEDGFPVTILMQRELGDPVDVAMVMRHVDRRAGVLKQHANQDAEKAIVEIVALMFQAILAEERIPAVVRVWFARLQIPVLRVAMVDPDFFKNMDHPARQLIDRMGGCVMGFDAAVLEGGRLETEIRRIVQVIEQYPETGKRVFQLVFDEFRKFLSRYLTGASVTQKIVSIAQQVEQKEALSIQYTIELRKLLDTMPVSEEVREFMFRVWADVMAMGAVRNGNQHADTLALKRTATDLVWAASPKPTSRERTAVIQALPSLLQRLRKGMDMLGLPVEKQEPHIKSLNDAVAQAFLNRSDAITADQIEQLARSLAALEDVVTDDAEGDFMLDPTSIELMLGIDASALEVISQGGVEPSEGMLSWARDLGVGQWFQLHHLDQKVQVQYAWRSDRGQLHLFSAASGQGYLIQSRRLASYMQAGLIFPSEEEALTVRATRIAIAKLEAEPTRLLK